MVSVLVTAGTIMVFGKAITDPVEIVGRVPNTLILVVGAVMYAIATIGINIVANFVSPAYDLANVAPKYINFQRGGIIAAVLSVLVMPWKLYASPVAVNYFLGGLGAFLGPLFGIIFLDYYVVRRQAVAVDDLFVESERPPYWYQNRLNLRVVAAFVPAAAIAAVCALVPGLSAVAPFSWFIGAVVAAVIYGTLALPAAQPTLRPVGGAKDRKRTETDRLDQRPAATRREGRPRCLARSGTVLGRARASFSVARGDAAAGDPSAA